jgi:hypothetical protein
MWLSLVCGSNCVENQLGWHNYSKVYRVFLLGSGVCAGTKVGNFIKSNKSIESKDAKLLGRT